MQEPDRAHSMDGAGASPGDAGELEIRVDFDHRINYAMQQNDVPVIHMLQITNHGKRGIDELTVRISIDSGIAEPHEIQIEHLGAGDTLSFETPYVDLDPATLARTTEKETARLRVVVIADRVTLASAVHPVEVLAYNEWGGLRSLPEMIAAFVMPNHPVIAALATEVASQYERYQGTRNVLGYQAGDPDKIRAIAEACFAAVQMQAISYSTTPPSFEQEGQKVRSPDQILERRHGNCLDLTVLFASMLEHAGLHPIVIFVDGHALIGAWLRRESFAEPAFDDVTRLRKRIAIGDIVAFDAASVTATTRTSFAQACSIANEHLDRADLFRCAVDIHCARSMSVRPLPYRMREDEVRIISDIDAPVPGSEHGAPDTPEHLLPGTRVSMADADSAADPHPADVPEEDALEEETNGASRLDLWKRRLLDLSLRNRLIHFRPTKKTLGLLEIDLSALEDALADGQEFAVYPRPTFMDPDAERSEAIHTERTQRNAVQDYVASEFRDRRLRTPYEEDELDDRLRGIYRAARNDLEETGANRLYLAIGFLVWFESADSKVERRAPILLLPLQLLRRSVSSGYRIRLTDDDPHINVTLLEKLESEFGLETLGLRDLPEDDSGLDVGEILRRFRAAVKNVPRFDVVEEAVVGLFSFTKFLMWSDLQDRSTRLLESPVVRHLVEEGGAPFDPDAPFPDPDRLDRDFGPEQILCPLDADSSQLAAVLAGAAGRSFVLQGPPGTGKSQTITNLIAHALGLGQRVLFVAAKRAALEVVHNRLGDVGLAPFCLELHSNKTSKRYVLDQIAEALDVKVRHPEGFASHAEALAGIRDELNEYVDVLHEPHAIGWSVAGAVSRSIRLREAPRVPVEVASPDAVDREMYEAAIEVADRLRTAASSLGDLRDHPLAGVGRQNWEASLSDQVIEQLRALEHTADRLDEQIRAVAPHLDLTFTAAADADGASEVQLAILDTLTRALVQCPAITRALLEEPGWGELRPRLESWIARIGTRNELRKALGGRYVRSVLDIDLEKAIRDIRTAHRRFPPFSWIKSSSVRRSLKSISIDGTLPDNDRLLADLERALELREEEAALADPTSEARAFFGRAWENGDVDTEALVRLLDWAERFRSALLELQDRFAPDAAQSIRSRLLHLVTEERDAVRPDAPIGRHLHSFSAAVAAYLDQRTVAGKLLEVENEVVWGDPRQASHLAAIRKKCARMRLSVGALRDWCHWQRVRAEAVETGLEPILVRFDAGEFPESDFVRVLDHSLVDAWLRVTIDSSPVLRNFHAAEHERKIDRFRELDSNFLRLSRDKLRADLASAVPHVAEDAAATSEVGILQRQLKLKRRHMPVRRLIGKLPNLLPRLKPCFLMSPLSVAQYLDPEFPRFDLVIFDEASQIPVWDAIGAMARGTRVVVVGDSRQLPPTDFFQKVDIEDDDFDEDAIEEVESILDECEAGGLPQLRLLCHYRSRHESLIAFSNHHYYDNRLRTFPSPQATVDGLGVTLRRLEHGVYDRGKTRTNQIEAEEIVREIVDRLRQEGPRRSIGVVAFSSAQQGLIEDLLDEARRKHPEIEPHFGDDAEEPVFVKNLENVQGDERDVILFSICYGPDIKRRVAMTFGPLNREGGERRLNVAITRARREVLVFSSLASEHIDLARTRSVGVRHLKSFLEYAERGPDAISDGHARRREGGDTSRFESDIGTSLEERGWNVHPSFGLSGYRIDIAAGEHEEPDRYILGVESDGDSYQQAGTTRDRDRIRPAVLAGLGWTLHRVWATDWWTDREREIRRIEQSLETARRSEADPPKAADLQPDADGDKPAETTINTSCKAVEPAIDGSDSAPDDETEASTTTTTILQGPAPPPPPSREGTIEAAPEAAAGATVGETLDVDPDTDPLPDPDPDPLPDPDPDPLPDPDPDPLPDPDPDPDLQTYAIPRRASLGGPADFLRRDATARIAGSLIQVVDDEAPIQEALACRRVASHFGVERLTKSVQTRIQESLTALERTAPTPVLRDGFYWRADQDPSAYGEFRVPHPQDSAPRRAAEISPLEIANAVAYTLHRQVSLPEPDLVREVARLFGYRRVGTIVEESMLAGIAALEARGDCVRNGERITVAW